MNALLSRIEAPIVWLGTPLMRLFDKLAFGAVHVDMQGIVQHKNAQAEALLQGAQGVQLERQLRKMCPLASDEPTENTLYLESVGYMHILMVRAHCFDGFLALLECSNLMADNQMTQAIASMLAEEKPQMAAYRALQVLAGSLPGWGLALYEVDAARSALLCLAHVNLPKSHSSEMLAARPVHLATSLVSRAFAERQALQVANLARSFFPFERSLPGAEGLSALALPVCAGAEKEAVGVLYACGPQGMLDSGKLQFLRGALTDAMGAVLSGARRSARLEAEAKQAKVAAAQKERLALIGQLAAGVAHEINNPLSFVLANLTYAGDMVQDIVNTAQSVLAAGEDAARKQLLAMGGELQSLTEETLQGVQRIVAIVQALKGAAHSRPGERCFFEPTPSITQTVQFFTAGRACKELVHCTVPKLPRVVGNAGALSQVLLNLLANAHEAVNGEGYIDVSAEVKDRHVQLSVRDDGPGIPEHVQAHLFEPFFTTKPVGKGTGLGLHISRDLITQLGGKLSYETGTTGTTFMVELPQCEDSPAAN